jgi:hypothetical protein
MAKKKKKKVTSRVCPDCCAVVKRGSYHKCNARKWK